MIIKAGRERTLQCDDCESLYDVFDQSQFEAMVAAAKAEGWSVIACGLDFRHYCPDCRPSTPGARLAKARRMFGT